LDRIVVWAARHRHGKRWRRWQLLNPPGRYGFAFGGSFLSGYGPTSRVAETTLRDLEPAARGMGLQIQVFNASTPREIHAAFAALARERHEALFVGGDPVFSGRRVQLANLAVRHGKTRLAAANV
jgi:hypothetical protein